MSHTIYFDESGKIDNISTYSYYGAICLSSAKISEIEQRMQKIFDELKTSSELHFAQYKENQIKKYFQILNYILSEKMVKINVLRLNNKDFQTLGRAHHYTTKELKQYFYVKIPERLFYGAIRDELDIKHLEVLMDDSEEYQTLGIYDNINEQMKAHGLYRNKTYSVKDVRGVESKDTKLLQVLDTLLGIVVYLLEEKYHNLTDGKKASKNKADLIYRTLSEGENLKNLSEMVTIFSWDNQSTDHLPEINFTDCFGRFCLEFHKNDLNDLTRFYPHFQNHYSTFKNGSLGEIVKCIKDFKVFSQSSHQLEKLTNKDVPRYLGFVAQLVHEDRNKFIR